MRGMSNKSRRQKGLKLRIPTIKNMTMDSFVSALFVLGLFHFSPIDGAINSWAFDGGSAGATLTHSATLAEDATTIVTALATTDTAGATAVTHTIGTQTTAGQFEIAAGATATGVVTLVSGQSLDAETATTLTIEVVATDDGTVPESATATITLTITDVNDNTPAFTMPSGASVSVAVNEGSDIGTAVYTVSAADADITGNTITYAFASGNTNSDFAIDSSTGKITTAKALTRATTATYTLSVSATDSGSPTDSDAVTVSVVVWDFNCSSGSGVRASMFVVLLAAICAFFKRM